jgi:hypothetical protein
LFAVPAHVSFATISEFVTLGLASARGVDRHRRLVAAISGGLPSLVAAGEAELGGTCWVLTATGQVVVGPDLEPSRRAALARRLLRADRLPVVVSGDSVFAISGQGHRGWFVVVAGDHREWDTDRQAVASEFVTLVGLERSRLDEARRIENRAARPLLRVLLSEQATQQEIDSRLAATGLAHGPVVVLAGGAQPVVEDLLAALPGLALVGVAEEEVFGLLGTPDPEAVVASVKETVRVLDPVGLSLGLSRCPDPTGLRAAVQEARHARKLAELSGGRTSVVVAEEVASHLLLMAALPDELRRSFRERILGPLTAYDATHKSELVRTLRVFLEHSGSWAATAAELHVHVNTLRYRIGRIADLTGRDLNRFPDRVDLYLALDHSSSGP